ncbi:MAG: MarR family transcriptional regulator [Actinomycetota bacterium]|nr:MarR family transcriptional regulator [Actinomycetota bacterium]
MVAAPLPASSFIGLAAHPIRWGLLTELAQSDRHVSELTHLLGQPQALVSYHLGRLRDGGLVDSRRSAHDGRASYYRLDLQRCGDALSATGSSLHPGLTLRLEPPAAPQRGRVHRTRVLFACTGNGARSQMAEALLQHRAGDRVDVVSGGSHPKPIHPNAVRALAERGIDIGDRQSKPLTRFDGQHFDHIVTLCDRVREACPEFSGRPQAIHWSIADPSRAAGGNRATYPIFRDLASELDTRISFLTALIDHPPQEATRHVRPRHAHH